MDTTIPSFMRDLNVDAVAWREARQGDFVLLLDPQGRANYDVFRLMDAPTFSPDSPNGVMRVATIRVQAHDGVINNLDSMLFTRDFSRECWQVWRDFGPRQPVASTDPFEGIEDLVDPVDGLTEAQRDAQRGRISSTEILFMNEEYDFEGVLTYTYTDGVLAGVVEWNTLGHAWVQRVGEVKFRCPRLDCESPTVHRMLEWNIEHHDPSGELEFLWVRRTD